MLSRRRLLHGAACACGAASLVPFSRQVHAASAMPKTALSADQALALLKEGNDAFVKGSCAATGAPLIVVLGHTQCGAVDAAVKAVKDGTKFPGAIGRVVAPIIPAVRSVKGKDDVVNRAVRANVERTVAQLKTAKPIVAKAVSGGTARVVGGVYDLQSGRVTFMA